MTISAVWWQMLTGVLWIGTDDGLLSYGDHRFRRYDQSNGLPSPAIRKLTVTAGGSVAVETSNGDAVSQAGRFAPVAGKTGGSAGEQAGQAGWRISNTFVSRISGGQPRSWTAGVDLPGTHVETIFVDRSGGTWVGTNGGLALIRKDEDVATAIEALRGNIVVQVFEDREGDEWGGDRDLRAARIAAGEVSLGSGPRRAAADRSGPGKRWCGLGGHSKGRPAAAASQPGKRTRSPRRTDEQLHPFTRARRGWECVGGNAGMA